MIYEILLVIIKINISGRPERLSPFETAMMEINQRSVITIGVISWMAPKCVGNTVNTTGHFLGWYQNVSKMFNRGKIYQCVISDEEYSRLYSKEQILTQKKNTLMIHSTSFFVIKIQTSLW